MPAIGLGAMEVSPLDMASAYATLAAGGIYSEPTAIRKVVLPDGEDKSWGKPKRRRVISDGVAYEVTRILEENMQYGTGTGAVVRPGRGGQDRHDGGALGRLVLRLHATARDDGLGRLSAGEDPDGRTCTASPSRAARFPAEIWRLFMSSAIGQLDSISFPEPTSGPSGQTFERGTFGRSFGYTDDEDDDDDDSGYVAPPPPAAEPPSASAASAEPTAEPTAEPKKQEEATAAAASAAGNRAHAGVDDPSEPIQP